MSPTTTDFRANRCLDDAHVPSLLEEDLKREGNKRRRLNSNEIREAASSNNKIHLIDFMSIGMGMPDAVYPLIWSFLLNSASGTASSVDFKSILSFMLVNKTSKVAFDDCRGWWLCAQALKREAEAKRLLDEGFRDRAMYLVKLHLYRTRSYREEIKRAREVNSRILSIQSALLPEASRLAILYDGDIVSMHQYHSSEEFIDRVEFHVLMFRKVERLILLERSRSRVVTPVTVSPNSGCFSWIMSLFGSS
jgi:hypothetical protein